MNAQYLNLERLYQEAGPQVFGFLRRSLASLADVEELLQEVFVVAARDPASLERAQSQRAWLLGIARNLIRSHRRRSAIRQTTQLSQEQPAQTPEVEDPRLDDMRRAMASLPEAQREVLQHRLIDELSYAEIAEALDVPIGTIRSRLHAAVSTLRNNLVIGTAGRPVSQLPIAGKNLGV